MLARVPNGSPRGSFVSHRQLRDDFESLVKDPISHCRLPPRRARRSGSKGSNGDEEEVLSEWLVAGNATSVKASDRDPRGVDVKEDEIAVIEGKPEKEEVSYFGAN